MGGFLLKQSSETVDFDLNKALSAFTNQGFEEPIEFSIGTWSLFLFEKQKVKALNYIKGENLSVFCCGTLLVHGLNPSQSINEVYNFYSTHKKLPQNLLGSYCIIIEEWGSLNIFVDPENIYNVFHTKHFDFFSSSFLSICEGLSEFTINRPAVEENICTGSLIGNDTIFNEIFRIDNSINYCLNNIVIHSNKNTYHHIPYYKSKEESQRAQIEALDRFFEGLKPTVAEYGLDSGLTGGFDSRLLLTLIKRHYLGLPHQFHSHKRKKPGPEYTVALELCSATESKFIDEDVPDVEELSNQEMLKALDQGMLFYDGQIRAHAFWHEPYNTASYREKILNNKGIGFHGIGGEQYRNFERFFGKKWNLNSWIRYGLIRRIGGAQVLNDDAEDLLIERISQKLKIKIGVREKLNHLDIKRYMNEVYIPANRGARTSMENKLTFFISPFTAQKVALTAYGAVPFLGKSLNYQAELISMLDPNVAAIKSDYGFDFVKGEPFSSYAPLLLAENLLPWPVFLKLKSFVKKKNRKSRWTIITNKYSSLNRLKHYVDSFNFGFNTDKLLESPDLGPLVFSLGYLLKHFESKIK